MKTKMCQMAITAVACLMAAEANAQFKYDNDAEVKAARLGVERSARVYFSHYVSPASDDGQLRWV